MKTPAFSRRFLYLSFGRAFSKMAVFSRHFCLLRLGSPGPFSKGLGAVEGAEPSSPSQRRNSLAAFLFAKLFHSNCGVKEKAGGRLWRGSRVS